MIFRVRAVWLSACWSKMLAIDSCCCKMLAMGREGGCFREEKKSMPRGFISGPQKLSRRLVKEKGSAHLWRAVLLWWRKEWGRHIHS